MPRVRLVACAALLLAPFGCATDSAENSSAVAQAVTTAKTDVAGELALCTPIGSESSNVCVVDGIRPGAFLVVERSSTVGDQTVVLSIPPEPLACPQQKFTVGVQPVAQTAAQDATDVFIEVSAPPSECSTEVKESVHLEYIRSLGYLDTDTNAYPATAASIQELAPLVFVESEKVSIRTIRPVEPIDYLATVRFERTRSDAIGGEEVPWKATVTSEEGSKCPDADSSCVETFDSFVKSMNPISIDYCGNCSEETGWASVFTRNGVPGVVVDMRAFLGTVDTDSEAAWISGGSRVARTGSEWVAASNVMGSDCPYEAAEVFQRVSLTGEVTPIARLFSVRENVCA